MSGSDINEVANYLISEGNIGVTHRELQKLLYFSQGFYLSEYGEPLFEENMDAWKFGPVNGAIWGRFRNFGYQSLHVSKDSLTTSLTENKKKFLTGILASFLALGEGMLIDMSHTDYTWERNYIAGYNKQITKPEIESYFNEFDSQAGYITIAKEKVEFSRLLTDRKSYLSSLDEIGSDWISGNAEPPSTEICLACKKFLHTFERNIFSKYASPEIPKLVMGPIPSGGVGIEFYWSKNNLYLSFHNDETVDITIESGGEFKEYDLTLQEFSEEIGMLLDEVA